MKRCWRIDDGRQSLVLGSHQDRLAEVIYWGPCLPHSEDLNALFDAHIMDVTGGMLDKNPEVSLCPEAKRSFPGQPGLIVRAGDGSRLLPDFRFSEVQQSAFGLTLLYRDDALGLTYEAAFQANPATHVFALSATLLADAPVFVDWLAAPVLPAPQLSDSMIDFSGRWCGEFKPNHVPWTAGAHVRESRIGRTGHEHFPGLYVPCRGATNTQGSAYAIHYGWSGGHRMIAEELPDGRRQIQFGHASDIELEAARRFETATLYITSSVDGLNGCAVAYQRHLRDEILTMPHPERPRPVHYNCWEAIYFDHDVEELKAIANRAAELGAERFVLDDGWFGKRDDDTSSLGDWVVDDRKYPQGLTPLIEHIHGLGMTFGIWFEPEMVNEESEIYRAHPEWVLGTDDQIRGRQQLVFDMANEAVRDYLFDHISAVLAADDIDYIKWDHNRVLPFPDSKQTHGTYALIDRLRGAYPDVEIESCASGGGRIDFGILKRTQRVWLSDSNDAIERLRIQHDAALFLPLAVTGSHVGPRICHTSGRVLDIRLRAWVAAQRHMGFEMDPRELSEDEATVLANVTSWWKANRSWMQLADILRLESADPAVIAEQQLARDGSRFVVFAGKAATSSQIAPRPLRLTNLDADARYRVELINKEDSVGLSRGYVALKSGALELSGAYLMQFGLTLPWSFPDTIWVVEGQKL
ncbi:alpha-galactosidase [Cohaesibacter celericrescens]|uniref:alpha-galactosidase n=1 Tax=Cohaesibacter celericrescens TaxID=2067669 RepID=UPI003569ED57